MNEFLNVMRAQGSFTQAQRTPLYEGIITSYDPSNATAIVNLLPDNTGKLLTAPVDVSTGYIGLNAAPKLGDKVVVGFINDNINLGVILGFLYNDEDAPPPTPSGEWWIINQASGSYIKIKNNGEIDINGQLKLNLNTPELNVVVTGNCNVNAQNLTANISNNANITAVSASVSCPDIKLGQPDSPDLKPIMLSDSSPSQNVQAT